MLILKTLRTLLYLLISCAIIPLQVSVAECSFKTYVHPKLNRWKIVLRSEIARLIDLESVLADPESVLPAPTLYGLYTDACSRGGRLPLSLESDPNLLKFLRNKLRDRIDELDDSETVLLDPVSAELAEEIMKFRRRELEVCGKPTSRQEHFLENGGQYVLNFGPEPETLNEKTLWISRFYYGFHEYNSSEVTSWIWNKLTAKLFIRDVVGAKYVARLYGAFKNLKDLLRPKFWKKLPQKFVVKGVLGCFGNCVRVVDKSDPKTVASLRDLEYTKTSRLTEESLIVEEYLPSLREGRTVTDYKFFCSFGKIIWVVIGDAPVDLVKIGPLNPLEKFQSLYTVPSWHFLDATYYDLGRVPIERPPNLPEMMEIAQKLSSGFPLVRIDLYLTKDEEDQFIVKVGEITTRAAGGISVVRPICYDYLTGALVPTMNKSYLNLLKDRDLIEVHEWMEKLKQSTDLMHDTMMPGFNCTPHINWDSLSPWAEKRLQGSSIKEIKDSRCQEINKLPPLLNPVSYREKRPYINPGNP